MTANWRAVSASELWVLAEMEASPLSTERLKSTPGDARERQLYGIVITAARSQPVPLLILERVPRTLIQLIEIGHQFVARILFRFTQDIHVHSHAAAALLHSGSLNR